MRQNCFKLLCRGNEDGFRDRWPHWGTLQMLLLVSKTPAAFPGFQVVWHPWTCTVCLLHWLFLPEGTRPEKMMCYWKAWCHVAEVATQKDFCHGRSLKSGVFPFLASPLILLSLVDILCHTPLVSFKNIFKSMCKAFTYRLSSLCLDVITVQVHIVFVVGFSLSASRIHSKTTHLVGSFCNLRERYILHLNPGAMDHTSR